LKANGFFFFFWGGGGAINLTGGLVNDGTYHQQNIISGKSRAVRLLTAKFLTCFTTLMSITRFLNVATR